MKKITLNVLFLASVLSLASCGNHDTDSKDMAKEENKEALKNTDLEDDAKFAVNAADGGMLEVQLGQLAETNGMSQQVKDLGKMMVDDHSKANEELKAWAMSKNVALPATLSDKSQKKYDDLAKKTGKDFDEAYTDAMVSDHKDDIDLFKKEADKGKDADLQTWAAGKVPTLEHHLMMSESAKDAVKNAK